MAQLFPMTVELKVHITDGNQVGSVQFVSGHGKLPTDGDMPAILERVKAALPDGFRLMDRAESTMFYLREEKGYRGPNLVIPTPENGAWFDKEADKDWTYLGHTEEADDEDEE